MAGDMLDKFQDIQSRIAEIDQLMNQPQVLSDRKQSRELGRERSRLEPVASCYEKLLQNAQSLEKAEGMQSDPDPEMRALAEEESRELKAQRRLMEEELQRLLLPVDPDDDRNTFVEIRSGTGGQEASLFVGDLMRMYCRYAERCGWRTELYSASATSLDGYREVVLRVIGTGAWAKLKFEAGGHRVQRVPETEAQGRIHTSACTVAVLAESEEIDDVAIDSSDLRVDTYRASGAGGQHVNKTDSAVRITHMPTGVVVECQEERSQHKNRAKAMSLLRARLLQEMRNKRRDEEAQSRRQMVGSGDRSERIRTYNFPQNRVTDHRAGLTLYQLDSIMLGDLDGVIGPLMQEHQERLLRGEGGLV